jgi:hypothetical protein
LGGGGILSVGADRMMVEVIDRVVV